MEILLIGNGFDLAHQLPTSYKDFLRFCEKVKLIYSYEGSCREYHRQHMAGWDFDEDIKNSLLRTFETRSRDRFIDADGTYLAEYTTPNSNLNDMYTLLHNNTWVDYFSKCSSLVGENWIDFELEISKVIQSLDAAKFQVDCGGCSTNIESSEHTMLKAISQVSQGRFQNIFKDADAICRFASFLYTELERLTRALEIYISGFINTKKISQKNPDIEKINPDYILSFNYSNTYERVYGTGKNIVYNYIHGKAEIKRDLECCDLVLGIDEYLADERKDMELDFLPFKKYYQRIYKSADNTYLEWVDRIKEEDDEHQRIIEATYQRNIDLSSESPFQKRVYTGSLSLHYPTHILYIFGHSLDVTDKDVLKKLICSENVMTKIFYHREYENDKRALARLIKNLVKIIGQDELIRKTGGRNRTIEFIPQTIISN